ncbi:hybrid sensor histidine kinase/response regulator [Planktothricoides raciborskii]|uniref:Circadian input-output histidine kinase CikA n=3 Tax=Planktothricoides TaxID=132607 RepID=A0AAU8J8S4_9CYAN|nr:ATP-binding protein [Planktothricoides raciborskii]KOR35026.1 histidine kinase [Planktothricoides sp. SR001]MBD2546806.1 response regulator [Planktothricoides raciborskii FACHB-1370]MBD2583077.1 response regulator [Planktothricoides raciborskii FACHB-1261]
MSNQLVRLTEEQELILNQVDNAIAWFNPAGQLILYNQPLQNLWGLEPEWLNCQPRFAEITTHLIEMGYWRREHQTQLQEAIAQTEPQKTTSCLLTFPQMNLQADITVTNDRGYLLVFRDLTKYHRSQESLQAEVKRLRFLLGLTQRLQAGGDLMEIGQFALTYLVKAMNAAFGDVKVISGDAQNRYAGVLTNKISSQFIATYGDAVVGEMQDLLNQGIPYGQGLLWDVVDTGKPVFVENYAQHPKAVANLRHPGIGQLGIFPIPATTGEIIGVLTLESRTVQKLQEAPNQDLLFGACRLLGAAIERAQTQEILRQKNLQLERASALKSQFLAAMSHELRTPLNSILGFSDILQRQIGGTLTNRQLNHVKAISKSGQHLLGLINDILDLSKIEAGKVDLDLAPVSIHELCSSCLKMIQPRADKKKLALSLELDYRLSKVLLDERRVRQILVNLLSNAIKFTPEGGQVKLTGKLKSGDRIQGDYRPDCSTINSSTPYLCLEVKDSGIGIPQENWHLLFRPFQQVDSSLSRSHEGTGLGLVLTKRLAELHGGTISFQSKTGVGSTFRVWLPVTEVVTNVPDSSVGMSQNLSERDEQILSGFTGKRILIVEDQPSNQILMAEYLESLGYLIELICDGQTMVETIDSELITEASLPDLVLMDIQLPQVDGLELIRRIKAHTLWQRVPVVAVTALAMTGDRERCLAAGAATYLSKPFKLAELSSTIESIIDRNSP